MSEPMDELEAVERAKNLLCSADFIGMQLVRIDREVLRALLARAQRPHD